MNRTSSSSAPPPPRSTAAAAGGAAEGGGGCDGGHRARFGTIMHVHNSSAPCDNQREIVDWSACRRGVVAAGRLPAATGSRSRCPDRRHEVIHRGGFRPARPRFQDALGRHYSPPACQKVFGDVRPVPGPPVTSLEASGCDPGAIRSGLGGRGRPGELQSVAIDCVRCGGPGRLLSRALVSSGQVAACPNVDRVQWNGAWRTRMACNTTVCAQ